MASERSSICICGRPQRRHCRLGSAADPRALDARRSPGPWRHKGWGALLQRTKLINRQNRRRLVDTENRLTAGRRAGAWGLG